MFKRIVVTLALFAAIFAVGIFAEEPIIGGVQQKVYAATVVDSGTCGDSLTWTLDDEGTLTISGCGSMKNFYSDAPWADYNYDIYSVVIGNGVTSIGYSAFEECRFLEDITIPDTVTSIGNSAFYSCESLESIAIPSGITSIGSYTFSGCKSLESIILPSNVTSIGEGAFYNCNSLKSIKIPSGVTSIEYDTFYNCKSLTDITIPDTVKAIGNSAFWDCESLESIAIPNSVTSVGNFAFAYCESLKDITIPNGVSFIGDGTFAYCESLTNIIVPSGVKSIGDHTFAGCKSLTDISVPSTVVSIGDYVFFYCESLTGITIPSGVKSIGDSAFEGCKSLESITVPNGVTAIGDYTFAYCESLTDITIPSGVDSIGGSAFRGCSSLKSITIPSTVTSIGDYAFYNCESLANITLPSGVKSIGDYTFAYCESLTDITIPSGVDSIGGSAFRGCSSLKSITIPSTVTSIGDYAFYYCYSLADVYYFGKQTDWDKIDIGSENAYLTIARIHFVVPVSIVSQPVDASALNGDAVKVTVETQGDGVTYQWYIKNKGASKYSKSSVTSNTYSTVMDESKDGRVLQCVIKDRYGNTIKSDIVTITMIPPTELKITKQPVNTSAADGELVSVSIEAEGDGLTYQWWIKNKGDAVYSKSSITTNIYSAVMNETRDGRIIRCVVKDKYGNLVRSDIVTISMKAAELKITQQPVNTSAANGETVKVTVEAEGDGVTYQWYIKNKGATKYTKSSITSNTYSAVMDESRDGRILQCVIKDKYGNLVRSDIVTISMKAAELKITQQPVNTSAASGETVKVTVKAEGDGVTYQWYIKNKGATKYTKSSITSNTYSAVMDEARDGRILQCVIKDKYGNMIKSDVVTITMLTQTPLKITQQPVNASAANGEYVSVTVKAQGDGVTYQWWVKNPGDEAYTKSSITSNVYQTNMTAAKDGRILRCVIKDKYGNLVRSDIVTISMS